LAEVLNLGYFGVEFVMARVIGSVSLFADSIDFLEDATVNGRDPDRVLPHLIKSINNLVRTSQRMLTEVGRQGAVCRSDRPSLRPSQTQFGTGPGRI
jgi:hypothetical protein